MKNLFLAFVLFLGSSFLFAHHNSYGSANRSDLNIKMGDNSSFIITLDNRKPERTRSFYLRNIIPGNHHIKIVKKTRNRNGKGFFVRTIYNGNIKIPARRSVFVKVEGKNRLRFKFFKKRTRYGNSGKQHVDLGGNGGNDGYFGSGNFNNNCDSRFGSNGNGEYYGESNFGNGEFDHNYLPNLMNQNRFNQLIRVLENEYFDDVRLQIAKQAIASNAMSVNQVSVILSKFTFDDAKLEFAKMAYDRTVDRENYFLVNSKFTFSRSISELNKYILNS